MSVLALAACSSDPGDDKADASTAKSDAGPVANGPLEFPVARMDDGQLGFSHDRKYDGVVAHHGTAQTVPSSFGNVRPQRVLSLRAGSGATTELYYTLPRPFTSFKAQVNENVKVHYAERVESYGASYGAKVEGLFGGLRVLFDEGRAGPVFDVADRLNFTIERDEQAVEEEADECGRKVRYPAIVGQGEERKRLFPGETATYTVEGVEMEFTLLDLYRIEDAVCTGGPEFSVAYLVLPKDG